MADGPLLTTDEVIQTVTVTAPVVSGTLDCTIGHSPSYFLAVQNTSAVNPITVLSAQFSPFTTAKGAVFCDNATINGDLAAVLPLAPGAAVSLEVEGNLAEILRLTVGGAGLTVTAAVRLRGVASKLA